MERELVTADRARKIEQFTACLADLSKMFQMSIEVGDGVLEIREDQEPMPSGWPVSAFLKSVTMGSLVDLDIQRTWTDDAGVAL